MHPVYLKGIFLSVFKDDIKAELKLHRVEDLAEMMDLAQLIDDRNQVLKRGGTIVQGRGVRSYTVFPSARRAI